MKLDRGQRVAPFSVDKDLLGSHGEVGDPRSRFGVDDFRRTAKGVRLCCRDDIEYPLGVIVCTNMPPNVVHPSCFDSSPRFSCERNSQVQKTVESQELHKTGDGHRRDLSGRREVRDRHLADGMSVVSNKVRQPRGGSGSGETRFFDEPHWIRRLWT